MQAIKNRRPTLDKLLNNAEAIVTGFTTNDRETFLLREMGLTVGRKLKIAFRSPFNSPFCVEYAGYRLLIGKETAEKIIVKPCGDKK